MRNLFTIAFLTIFLAGCSLIKVPSFWDPNQAQSIVDVQFAIEKIDCDNLEETQITAVTNEIEWFQTYSKSYGWRHQDMLELIEPLDQTVSAFEKRYNEEESINPVYCNLKKKNMQQQSARAAQVILKRFKL
jgi:hypothetical protein